MIPNQYRRPSMDVMEITERLLAAGRVEAAVKVMDYALAVVSSEREQLRADRDAARQKIRAMDQIAAMKIIQEQFGRLVGVFKDIFTGLQKPHAKSDYAKAN